MILKGSQRSGARQLAVHLLNTEKGENDHVTVAELRGFVSNDLFGALAETHAIARGTKCQQCVFSLSLSPPIGAQATDADFLKAADRAEEILGLDGQPRAIVLHEKNGRRHAHVVWSRIDAEKMKAINLPHFKRKLNALAKDLYLEHGWELPDGLKTNGWKNPLNFTLAEWQQAKRQELDPREIKMVLQNAWQRSDNLSSFRNALEEHGYYLAKGDRRGLVVLDLNGEAYSLSRWTGLKTKELALKLGEGGNLPGVEQVRADTRRRVSAVSRQRMNETRDANKAEMQPLTERAERMKRHHAAERSDLQRKQNERWKKETQARAAKFRRGLGIILDVVTGRIFALRKENEQEAFQGYLRDRSQREQLCSTQLKDRRVLQDRIDEMKAFHRTRRENVVRRVAAIMRMRWGGPAIQRDKNLRL